MKVTALYCYPIKSLRGIKLDNAQATRTGFPYDRRFMLQKVLPKKDTSQNSQGLKFKNMSIGAVGKMSLFQQEFLLGSEDDWLRVTYTDPESAEQHYLEIPLSPKTEVLEEHHIDLHTSKTKAYRMGERYDEWFSARFGYSVALIYIGPHHRPVLGNINPGWENPVGWSLSMLQQVPLVGSYIKPVAAEIDFADIAAYLITTEESLQNVSDRLPEGEDMDMTKFRPNIVLSESTEQWDEDFWSEIQLCSANGNAPIDIVLTANCGRCNSINVDYATGKNGTGPSGRILNLLRKDRCVDVGQKSNPVFGRYGFLMADTATDDSTVITVGDEARVTKRTQERSVLDLGT